MVLIAVGLVLAPAAAASAAGVIELSDDGSAWSTSLGGPLFATAPQLVPMQSQSASFWVRNATPDDAYLRLTVDNLSWTGTHYAAALSLAASVPGAAGAPLALGTATGCLVLLEGVLLPAGQAVQVSATLALGNLDGTTGQMGTASMDIAVGLEQATSSAPAPGCAPAATPATTIVVVPPSGVAAAPTGPQAVSTGGEAAIEVPVLPLVPGTAILALLPNTLVRFDSSVVGWATAGLPLGAALFFIVGVIRRMIRGPEASPVKEHQS